MIYRALVLFSLCIIVSCWTDWSTDINADKWKKQAKDTIDRILESEPNRNIAKNLILYLGDGMGISTVTSGRILKGQLKNKNGEEEVTIMESMDNVGLSKVTQFFN